MIWHEELPQNCPPKNSKEPNGDEFYRLCAGNPALSSDFWSQKKENPHRKFGGIPPCVLSSVSIWNDKNKCLELKKFPTQKNKKLGKVILNPSHGKIENTFKPNHFSWWRSNNFDPGITIIID